MSRLFLPLLALLAVGCTVRGVVQTRLDGGGFDAGIDAGPDLRLDAGPPPLVRCLPRMPTTWQDVPPNPPSSHEVDGAFTGSEWDHVRPLEGQYTDVYLDARDGFLHVLNDWRANSLGLLPSCFNEFLLTINDVPVTVRVFMNGSVTVSDPTLTAEGAFSFAPSPRWPFPHTIYEFRLSIPPGTTHVCCLDPLTRDQCDQLTLEPMIFTIEHGPLAVRIRRSAVGGELAPTRLGEDDACGNNQGVCVEGLSCIDFVCQPIGPGDAGPGDAGPDIPDDDAGASDAGFDASLM